MATIDEADAALLREVVDALRAERRRAPADLLGILAVILVASSIGAIAAGVTVGPGTLQDVLLNLGGELVGVVLTVVLIGGLWSRVQAGSYGTMDDLVSLVEARGTVGLNNDERTAYRAMVELHRRTERSGFVIRLVTGLVFAVRNRRRLTVLERMLRKEPT
jgi:hypothetical protein